MYNSPDMEATEVSYIHTNIPPGSCVKDPGILGSCIKDPGFLGSCIKDPGFLGSCVKDPGLLVTWLFGINDYQLWRYIVAKTSPTHCYMTIGV